MSLVEHAESELKLAGFFDKDADYGGMLGNAVLELIDLFAKQGHSGFSAGLAIHLFNELAQYKPLTPLTTNPDEWFDISDMNGSPMWQSKRNSAVFSKDGGQTWYDLNDNGKV